MRWKTLALGLAVALLVMASFEPNVTKRASLVVLSGVFMAAWMVMKYLDSEGGTDG